MSIDNILKEFGEAPVVAALDEIVHEAASQLASNSNNEGVRGQTEFLRVICGWNDDEIAAALREELEAAGE